ncbi:MAG: LytTR family DNA-binding domain-containing protein [Bacteroidota bacterium]
MTVLIIEDEPLAAERLEEMILRYESHIEVVDRLDSVSRAVRFFKENSPPDLLFLDIQLADGLSFDIFDQVTVPCPIIFTTAYDQYALKAFKVNSIDYLLKPLDEEELAAALDQYVKQYQDVSRKKQALPFDLESLRQMVMGEKKAYKTRFVVKKGEHLVVVPVEDILYFYAEEKVVFMRTEDGRRFLIEGTLAEVEEKIDPDAFFRINRTYLVSAASMEDIVSFSNRRLKLSLRHQKDEKVLVAREKVKAFKAWLDR